MPCQNCRPGLKVTGVEEQNTPYQLPPPGRIQAPGKRVPSTKFLILYLFFGAFGIMFGYATVAVGLMVREEYLVTRGAAGTPGTVTITEKVSGTRGKSTCHGSFRPDAGGRGPTDVEVQSDGPCKRGKTARAYLNNESAYVAGENQNDWMTIFFMGPFLGAGALGFVGIAVLGVRHERNLRKQARSATAPSHLENIPYPDAQPPLHP